MIWDYFLHPLLLSHTHTHTHTHTDVYSWSFISCHEEQFDSVSALSVYEVLWGIKAEENLIRLYWWSRERERDHNIRAAYFLKFQQIKPNFMELPNAEKWSRILEQNSKNDHNSCKMCISLSQTKTVSQWTQLKQDHFLHVQRCFFFKQCLKYFSCLLKKNNIEISALDLKLTWLFCRYIKMTFWLY